jgi:SAM-dependent methyltransferase
LKISRSAWEGIYMPDDGRCKVYERIAAGGVTGGGIRPGGLELTERALSLCAFAPGSRLLDVGCGTGATVEHLIGRYGFLAAGVDPSLAMLALGSARNPLLPLIRAVGESLPFGDGEWDGVLAECSLSLTRDPDAALRECLRVLRRGGKLILSDVYVKNSKAIPELGALHLDCCLTGALPKDELMGKLTKGGATVLAWEDHSAALKHFAAQLILAGAAGRSLWCSLTGAGPLDGFKIEQVASRAGFGYFLAVAGKSVNDGCK